MVLNRVLTEDIRPNPNELAESQIFRIRTTTPSEEEIIAAINAFKNNKVVVLDRISVELLQAAPNNIGGATAPTCRESFGGRQLSRLVEERNNSQTS